MNNPTKDIIFSFFALNEAEPILNSSAQMETFLPKV